MGRNATEIERAVARTLRDSLEKLQRSTDEVNQAVGDLVSACASAKASNALPHMLRAQTAAASLAATLDVLSRFITSAMQPGWGAPLAQPELSPEADPDVPIAVEAQTETVADFAASAPASAPPSFQPSADLEPEPFAVEQTLRTVASETEALEQAAIAEPLEFVSEQDAPPVEELFASPIARVDAPQVAPADFATVAAQGAPEAQSSQPVLDRPIFDLTALPADQQELHRRANRVAKVSMQDIKMLRPDQVSLGKERKDLCARLGDDIERARKEYDRRFQDILGHPVDYFYNRMVEILGDGDPATLGEYPYPSPVLRR